MFIKVLFLLVAVYWCGSDAVRCRVCNQAASLDDCTTSTECGADEECYLDELVTAQLAIIFNGGCRASDICQSAGHPHAVGKRADSDPLIACSRCCNTSATLTGPQRGLECNAKMCGIKGSGNTQQCYFCDSTKAGGQGDVDDPNKCGSLGNCQTDEVCGTEMYALAVNQTFRYTCLNRRRCTILTHLALQEIERCNDPTAVAAGKCGDRKRSGQTLCTACCGDRLCNSGSCFQVLDRLYKLWKFGALDFKTLRANGTIPATTKAAPTTTKAVPTTIKAAPTTTKAAPTTTKAAPTTTKAAPTTTKAAPKTTKAVPVTTKAVPTTTKAAPTTTKAAPKTTKAAPTTTKAAPTTIKAVPTTIKAAPTTTKANPTTTKANPTTTKANPTTKSVAASINSTIGPTAG